MRIKIHFKYEIEGNLDCSVGEHLITMPILRLVIPTGVSEVA
jgi:hypothetical protein